jgi:cell division protein FtsL
MRPFAFFERRVRGFRVVELGGLGVLLILILTVYLAKTGAGGKTADIDKIQQQIFDEQTQIRMLRAEVANLEQPERLEALSARYLGLQPISARHEVTAQGLGDVARFAVVGQKPTLVTSDPLTQPGSPDLNTSPPGVAPANGAAPAPETVQAATPAVRPAATAPIAHPAAHPALKLAKADPAPRGLTVRGPAGTARASRPAARPSIDALLQDGPAPAGPVASEH